MSGSSRSGLAVGVFGAGAIGCWVGGWLALHDKEVRVTFVGRERLCKGLSSAGGMLVSDLRQEASVTERGVWLPSSEFTVTESPGPMSYMDVILVCVKCAQTKEAGLALCAFLPRNRPIVVVSLQNGVGNAEVLRSCLASMENVHVLAGMVGFNVVWKEGTTETKTKATKKGETGQEMAKKSVMWFHKSTDGQLHIERHASGSHTPVVSALQAAGIRIVTHSPAEMRAVMYGKLLINLINSVNALAGMPVAQMLRQRAYRAVFAAAMYEGLCVLKASGITAATIRLPPALTVRLLLLPDWLYGLVSGLAAKIDETTKSSMLQDLEGGRPTEIMFLNGEVLRLANLLENSQSLSFSAAAVRCPVNAKLVDLIQRAESANAADMRVGGVPSSPGLSGLELATVCQVPIPSLPLLYCKVAGLLVTSALVQRWVLQWLW